MRILSSLILLFFVVYVSASSSTRVSGGFVLRKPVVVNLGTSAIIIHHDQPTSTIIRHGTAWNYHTNEVIRLLDAETQTQIISFKHVDGNAGIVEAGTMNYQFSWSGLVLKPTGLNDDCHYVSRKLKLGLNEDITDGSIFLLAVAKMASKTPFFVSTCLASVGFLTYDFKSPDAIEAHVMSLTSSLSECQGITIILSAVQRAKVSAVKLVPKRNSIKASPNNPKFEWVAESSRFGSPSGKTIKKAAEPRSDNKDSSLDPLSWHFCNGQELRSSEPFSWHYWNAEKLKQENELNKSAVTESGQMRAKSKFTINALLGSSITAEGSQKQKIKSLDSQFIVIDSSSTEHSGSLDDYDQEESEGQISLSNNIPNDSQEKVENTIAKGRITVGSLLND